MKVAGGRTATNPKGKKQRPARETTRIREGRAIPQRGRSTHWPERRGEKTPQSAAAQKKQQGEELPHEQSAKTLRPTRMLASGIVGARTVIRGRLLWFASFGKPSPCALPTPTNTCNLPEHRPEAVSGLQKVQVGKKGQGEELPRKQSEKMNRDKAGGWERPRDAKAVGRRRLRLGEGGRAKNRRAGRARRSGALQAQKCVYVPENKGSKG